MGEKNYITLQRFPGYFIAVLRKHLNAPSVTGLLKKALKYWETSLASMYSWTKINILSISKELVKKKEILPPVPRTLSRSKHDISTRPAPVRLTETNFDRQ